MTPFQINGLQQIGIGTTDLEALARWYATEWGFDRVIVDDRSPAEHMAPLTLRQVREKHACMSVNLTGGGALEIWQSIAPEPLLPINTVAVGDIGIFAAKIGPPRRPQTASTLSEGVDPLGRRTVWLRDPEGNLLQYVRDSGFAASRGVQGAVLGVRNPDRILSFLQDAFGELETLASSEDVFADLAGFVGGDGRLHRTIVRRKRAGFGCLSAFLGDFELEVISARARPARQIYAGRSWGDPGFIHLAFDVTGAGALRAHLEQRRWEIPVDSGPGFRMGGSRGRFFYALPEPGLLFEFVEVERMELLPRFGLGIDMASLNRRRPFPRLAVKTMFRLMGRRIR